MFYAGKSDRSYYMEVYACLTAAVYRKLRSEYFVIIGDEVEPCSKTGQDLVVQRIVMIEVFVVSVACVYKKTKIESIVYPGKLLAGDK